MKGLKSIHIHCALNVTKTVRRKKGEWYSKFPLNNPIILDSTVNKVF